MKECLRKMFYVLEIYVSVPAQLSRLDGPGIESLRGGGVLRMSAPVQIGPGTHPASCRVLTGSLYRR